MLAHELDLKYAFGFQFKGGKLLECNPRVQGTMMASTFAGANIIYSAVKYALGEEVPEFNIDWDSRVLRYSILKAI
jgi:carbamoyl-phosphate synthase large subunit